MPEIRTQGTDAFQNSDEMLVNPPGMQVISETISDSTEELDPVKGPGGVISRGATNAARTKSGEYLLEAGTSVPQKLDKITMKGKQSDAAASHWVVDDAQEKGEWNKRVIVSMTCTEHAAMQAGLAG